MYGELPWGLGGGGPVHALKACLEAEVLKVVSCRAGSGVPQFTPRTWWETQVPSLAQLPGHCPVAFQRHAYLTLF